MAPDGAAGAHERQRSMPSSHLRLDRRRSGDCIGCSSASSSGKTCRGALVERAPNPRQVCGPPAPAADQSCR